LAKLGDGNYHFLLGGPDGPDFSVFDDLSDEDFDDENLEDEDDGDEDSFRSKGQEVVRSTR